MDFFKIIYFVKSLFVDATSTQEHKIRLTEKCVVSGEYGRLRGRWQYCKLLQDKNQPFVCTKKGETKILLLNHLFIWNVCVASTDTKPYGYVSLVRTTRRVCVRISCRYPRDPNSCLSLSTVMPTQVL